MSNSEDVDNKFDFHRLLLRKDRPLPKAGCSWAFYVFLLLIIVYLAFMYIKYSK